MAKRIIKPNVVSGGVAIPLGNNFYYMKGRKHKNGGIDIGSNPKTGIEVEDGEVMQMMQNGAKVFSSMPFLRGSSPANRVLAGENPDNVFRQQELYKDRNNINDDGTKKKAVGGQIPPYNTNGGNYKGSWGNLYPSRYFINSWGNLTSGDEYKGTWGNLYPQVSKDSGYYVRRDTLYKEDNKNNKFSNFFKNKDNLSDTIGIGSNILGSTLSYFANKRMLNNMKKPIKPKISAPVSYQATKLKTNVNINPQLDTLRNSSAIYNNSVDNNTASSRVALARKQANRLNINNQINTLYGNKENQETELINRDRLQQQQTDNQNIAQYNDYLTRKAAIDNEYNNQLINFRNTINEKKGENLVSLFNNSNAAIQDILNRREQRNNERNTIAAYLASNPNVNPRLFTRLGVDGVFTPEMIEAWEEEYKNNKKKTKTN